jgi:hypothetical protein
MARKANAFSFSSIIAEKRKDMARVRAELAALAGQSEAFAPAFAIANTLAKRGAVVGFSEHLRAEPSTYKSTWSGTVDNTLNIRMEHTVDSLKEGAVPAMIEAAMSMGFEAIGTHDYALEWCASRVFRFEMNINNVRISLRLEANIKDGSEACRKVQVGTKLEEVPQYELVCA